jgi:hypothetical protein
MSLTINAMTQEKLSLALPVMFTVGPEDSVEKLKKYAILLTGNAQRDSTHVQNVIKGVIEGEIRYEYMEVCLIKVFLSQKCQWKNCSRDANNSKRTSPSIFKLNSTNSALKYVFLYIYISENR